MTSREPSPRPLALILSRKEHLGTQFRRDSQNQKGPWTSTTGRTCLWAARPAASVLNKQRLASSLALRTSTPRWAILIGRRCFRTLSGNLSPLAYLQSSSLHGMCGLWALLSRHLIIVSSKWGHVGSKRAPYRKFLLGLIFGSPSNT